jgi:CheY-like chemotaxis protein
MCETLLIVDDDRAIVDLTAMWLRGAGYSVLTASDGTSGLADAAKHRPALIVLDIRMPDIDGFEFYRRIRQQPDLADIPVIFLTANVHEKARSQAMAFGAAAFLRKPYQPKQLLQAVAAALALTQNQRGREQKAQSHPEATRRLGPHSLC